MPRCPSCREYLPRDRERVGARCPYCRDPLYEPPYVRLRATEETASLCAVHPQNASVGTCQRCGNYLCRVCRTRRRDQSLCTTCIDHALEAKDLSPEESRAHFRQALLAISAGVAAWVLCLSGFVFAGIGVMSDNVGLLAIASLLLLGSVVPSALGLGQGATAVRIRGNHVIMATIGLLLYGLHIGAMIGVLAFSVWQR